MSNYGMLRVAAASPRLKVANPISNVSEMLPLVQEAERQACALLAFPELSVTGYTCGDLFHQKLLLNKTLDALQTLKKETANKNLFVLAGAPLLLHEKLFNCAVAMQRGKILGIVPKVYLPNYKEFYEKRWFSTGSRAMKEVSHLEIEGERIPFGRIIFRSRDLDFGLGVEICEDLWSPLPPSSYLTLQGANIMANLSASNELVAKSEYRRQLVAQQSARCFCGYIYSCAGVHESTTDVVFSGDSMIAENGNILAASKRFSRSSELITADLDMEIINYERTNNKSFADSLEFAENEGNFAVVDLSYDLKMLDSGRKRSGLCRHVERNPFVPSDEKTFLTRCEDIFNIQVTGLAKRLEYTRTKTAVIGVSGGLDSTLALLVAKRTYDLLELDPLNILGVTMPGFGTSAETYANALELMKALGVTSREIPITAACLQHFRDIGHDPALHDVTYENAQARERTQVLMDIANKNHGLVIGTGDLSELALGWSTYNGDHMSMYGVNCGVPKTLVKFLVNWVAENIVSPGAAKVLKKIVATPISPELLPPDQDGRIRQKTEDLIGPYELHDFFLFYTLRYGLEPQKILYLAAHAYHGIYQIEDIKTWLKLFYRRFFISQFKRSCLPDGPKVGSVSLSPRGDWRMPSDADMEIWLRSLD